VAESYDQEKGRYIGLRISKGAGVLTRSSLIVKPEIALAQQPEPVSPPPGGIAGHVGEPKTPYGTDARKDGVKQPTRPTTFIGSVELPAMGMGSKLGTINEEVFEHLTKVPGATVKLCLEVTIEVPGGVGPDTIRTVTENANSLKFKHCGFE
jgi:hypothetical protein